MVEPDQTVIDEAVHAGESMGTRDLFDLIERTREGPGVERQIVAAHAEGLADRRDYAFDAEGYMAEIDEKTTDAEWWEGPDRYYDLGESRLSQFPAGWHEELGDSTDAAEYVEFLLHEQPEFVEDLDAGAAGDGVPEETVVDVMTVVAGVDRETALTAIHQARDRGEIVEDADQSPDATVYPTEDAPESLTDENR